MKLVNAFTGFLAGAVVGAAASFYILKKKYEALVAEDHEQFRKDLENPEVAKFFYESALKKAKAKSEKADTQDESEDDIPKPFKRDKSKRQAVDYTSFYKKPVDERIAEEEDNEAYELTGDPAAVPVIISPDEYGDDDTYAQISLYYTTDGVLIDENNEVFENFEALCSDYEEHFDEHEADSVCMRNDRLRSYYEILKSLKSSREFLRSEEKRAKPVMVDDE